MTKVIKSFVDKENGKLYAVGQVFTGTTKRVAELTKSGYLDSDSETKISKKTTTKKASKKRDYS